MMLFSVILFFSPFTFRISPQKCKVSVFIGNTQEFAEKYCRIWTLLAIKETIKHDFGKKVRVYWSTCRELKRTAEMYQR
jgi:hypothetical protein